MNNSGIEIFKSEDGKTDIRVSLANDTVWLSQRHMAQLFDKDTDTIGLHLKNIYRTEELEEISTTEKFSVVQKEGTRNVSRDIKCYNLDAIISVGYRVNSKSGTQFRIWTSKILKDYLVKGYTLNEKKLIQQNKQLIRKINQNYNRINQTPCKPTNNWNSHLTLFNLPGKIYF